MTNVPADKLSSLLIVWNHLHPFNLPPTPTHFPENKHEKYVYRSQEWTEINHKIKFNPLNFIKEGITIYIKGTDRNKSQNKVKAL